MNHLYALDPGQFALSTRHPAIVDDFTRLAAVKVGRSSGHPRGMWHVHILIPEPTVHAIHRQEMKLQRTLGDGRPQSLHAGLGRN